MDAIAQICHLCSQLHFRSKFQFFVVCKLLELRFINTCMASITCTYIDHTEFLCFSPTSTPAKSLFPLSMCGDYNFDADKCCLFGSCISISFLLFQFMNRLGEMALSSCDHEDTLIVISSTWEGIM